MSLDLLQTFLTGLDPNGFLTNVSFSKTFNSQLGFGNDSFSPFQFIPYGNWSNYDNPVIPRPSVLEQAFADTIVKGHINSQGGDPDHSFIDILHLEQPFPGFFKEPLLLGDNKGKTVVEVIADTVNSMHPTITPVIRFLVGNPKPPQNGCPEEFTDVFWPGQKSIFTHPNAMLYVGTFNPTFLLPTVIQEPLTSYLNSTTEATAIVIALELLILEYMKPIANNTFLNPVTWNHAKIVAVNGRALLTGGGNYYDLYMTNGTLIDNDITILGDAAVDGHNYADYLWRYLNANHPSDNSSAMWSTKLSIAPPKSIPIGSNAPYYPLNTPRLQGKIPVLSVGKLGNFKFEFPDGKSELDYPMQIIDGARDFFLQALWAMGEKVAKLDPSGFSFAPILFPYTNDTALRDALAVNMSATPVAWASRAARNYAISNANKLVYMSQQMLVNWQANEESSWQSLVNETNKSLNITGTAAAWDGMIWPYDLLVAFATALANMEASNPKDPDAGIYIVVSQLNSNQAQDYEDKTPISEVTERLTSVLGNMTWAGELSLPGTYTDAPRVVSERFHMRRSVFADPDPLKADHKLHTKVVCVDESLLFIGSDNAYPQYNEQFGVWIEEKDNIKAWYDDFFSGLWERALVTQD
ncbi:hypothetical protein N431DRAFT_402426 [Stipitochalara longipes BDJ]|nr:hypothetical protein N431DRAFT_402426 [Stipitochalara longipes BDJ]